ELGKKYVPAQPARTRLRADSKSLLELIEDKHRRLQSIPLIPEGRPSPVEILPERILFPKLRRFDIARSAGLAQRGVDLRGQRRRSLRAISQNIIVADVDEDREIAGLPQERKESGLQKRRFPEAGTTKKRRQRFVFHQPKEFRLLLVPPMKVFDLRLDKLVESWPRIFRVERSL